MNKILEEMEKEYNKVSKQLQKDIFEGNIIKLTKEEYKKIIEWRKSMGWKINTIEIGEKK